MGREAIDLTGQKFGRLTVLERARSTKHGNAKWLCRCTCGKQTIVPGIKLRSGNTRSCGCLSIEKTKGRTTGENNYNWVGAKLKYNTAHMWMKRHKPRPAFCQMCRERLPVELSFNGKNGDWTRNPEDYEWVCQSCHRLKDRGQSGVKPLTRARVHRIREFYRVGAATQRELADLFKVTNMTISKIIRRAGIYGEG